MSFDFSFYWALLLRRLPIMILFSLLCSGMGVIWALRLPDVYSTSARLLVEESLIPDNMVASTIRTSAVEQLAIIEQRLMTRANMIDIANKFDVFEDIGSMDPDAVDSEMRKATNISIPRGGRSSGGATLMVIGFEGRTPQIAADVANEYVTLVLQENTRFRASRAENTLEFFEQEAERLSADLDSQSARIAAFKAENANALPTDQAFRVSRQALLQERLGQLERDLRALEERRESVLQSFEATGNLTRGATEQPRSAFEEQLIVSQAELAMLREDYSDDNPRVMRLTSRIERLEAIVTAQNAAAVAVETGDETSPQQALLNATLAEIDSNRDSLQESVEATNVELETLQENLSRSAANGIELAELERDYQAIQTRYNSAVTNLNTARMSERLETTAQGQRFSVIENANVPSGPSGPDRTAIATTAVAVGVGLAIGYFFLLEFLNRVIRRPAEIVERFETEPIAVIPYMESRRDRFLRRTGMVTATLAVLIAVPVGLWYVDTYYLPLELVVQRGIDRLGLG